MAREAEPLHYTTLGQVTIWTSTSQMKISNVWLGNPRCTDSLTGPHEKMKAGIDNSALQGCPTIQHDQPQFSSSQLRQFLTSLNSPTLEKLICLFFNHHRWSILHNPLRLIIPEVNKPPAKYFNFFSCSETSLKECNCISISFKPARWDWGDITLCRAIKSNPDHSQCWEHKNITW